MSVKWANNHAKPMTSSVVFDEHAPPANVGLNQYLSNAVKLRPQTPKRKRNTNANKTGQRKNRVTLTYCNTLPVPPNNPSFVETPEMKLRHEQCKLRMKQKRDKLRNPSITNSKNHTRRRIRQS